MDVMKNLIAVQSWKQIDWEGVGGREEEGKEGREGFEPVQLRLECFQQRREAPEGREGCCSHIFATQISAVAQAPLHRRPLFIVRLLPSLRWRKFTRGLPP